MLLFTMGRNAHLMVMLHNQDRCSWDKDKQNLSVIGGEHAFSPLLLVGVGSHGCRWNKHFWRSPQEDEIWQEALFLWNLTSGFPTSHFLQSSHRKSVAGVSAELNSEPCPEFPFHVVAGPIQHQANWSPLVHGVGGTWLWAMWPMWERATPAMGEPEVQASSKGEPRAYVLLFRSF